jgi:hypothetical protein
MGKACGGYVRRVLVENVDQEGALTKNITQEESAQEADFTNIHRKRFFVQKLSPYAGVGSEAALVITPSREQPGPHSMDHMLSPPTLIRSRRKSVKNVSLDSGNDSHRFSLHHHYHGGMEASMERLSRVELILGIGPALWPLHHIEK